MKVLVCGSRHFNDRELLERVLGGYPITELIEGEARGADTLAREWAEARGIPVQRYPADWNTYGKRAGPIRNSQMLREGCPDMVVAFRGPNSRGTRNMIDIAITTGVPVKICNILMQPVKIVEDKKWEGMWRLKWEDGVLSEDFYNKTRANDILLNYAEYRRCMAMCGESNPNSRARPRTRASR